MVNTILTQAATRRTHIEPMGDRVRVRNRTDGALHEVLRRRRRCRRPWSAASRSWPTWNIVDRRRPQDGQIETEVDGNELDIR
ncbi:MAG: hypothetical protein R2711_10630 [Acidimicrobiales bacterium]